jgi:aspartyl-tRNA(Asn)/glutamyl-tRNA(Gln) amidotransferase subunit B
MSKEKDVKIGLEIHGYLQTSEKLFCRCRAERHSSEKPNTFICPICTGQPGSKPMLPNSEAIKKLIQIGLILGCNINSKFTWQRKHYSWPDLPKGYQSTVSGAYAIPVGENGNFEGIDITEVHLEEDPASWDPETGCVDYNRSGLPLVEIVTEPNFKTSEQVTDWIKKLVLSLSYIKAVDKNAGLKADVNISINQKAGGNRVEVKNISSIEDIKNAIKFEIERQEKEGTKRETRRWDSKKIETTKMRDKEEAADYRFIPEPDLPIVNLEKKRIEEIKSKLPETPAEKLDKLIKKHKINKKEAEILSNNFELVEFFEKVSEKIPPEFVLPWVTIELLRVLNYNKKTLEEVEINSEHFSELLGAVKEKKLTELKAKQILNSFIPKSHSISQELKKSERITNEKEIEKFAREAIAKNKQAAEDFLDGKQESLNFLLGEIMKISNRRADFQTAKTVLMKLLKK